MAMMNGHSRHGDEEEERAVEDMIKLEYVALFFKLLFCVLFLYLPCFYY